MDCSYALVPLNSSSWPWLAVLVVAGAPRLARIASRWSATSSVSWTRTTPGTTLRDFCDHTGSSTGWWVVLWCWYAGKDHKIILVNWRLKCPPMNIVRCDCISRIGGFSLVARFLMLVSDWLLAGRAALWLLTSIRQGEVG